MSVTRLICKCGYPQVYCKCPLPSAPSAQAPVQDRGAGQLVGSGSFVRLRSLGLVCVAQASMALVMAALGIVDRWTVYPACYFSITTFVGVWLMRDKPNIAGLTAAPKHSKPQP